MLHSTKVTKHSEHARQARLARGRVTAGSFRCGKVKNVSVLQSIFEDDASVENNPDGNPACSYTVRIVNDDDSVDLYSCISHCTICDKCIISDIDDLVYYKYSAVPLLCLSCRSLCNTNCNISQANTQPEIVLVEQSSCTCNGRCQECCNCITLSSVDTVSNLQPNKIKQDQTVANTYLEGCMGCYGNSAGHCANCLCTSHCDTFKTSLYCCVCNKANTNTMQDQQPTTLLPEPLLTRDLSRFSLMPIKYPDVYEFYKNARLGNWESDEGDLSKDLIDLNDVLISDERHAVLTVFAFFQPADGIVSENLVINFYAKICIPEIRMYYAYQISIEAVHADAYGIILNSLVPNMKERLNLLNAIENLECVKRKAEWALRWIDNGTFAESVFAFALVEGLFFSSSFCIIYWLKKRGLMPGVCFYNDKIAPEEFEHCVGASLVWKYIVNKFDKETAYRMVKSAMEAEILYVDYVLPRPLIGMNATLMKQHVEFTADVILNLFGFPPLYKTPTPFEWMNMMGLQGKASFFEKKVAEYSKSAEIKPTDSAKFTISEDF